MIVLSAPFDHKHRLTTAVLCAFRLHGYILANLYPFSILRSFRSSHKRCVKFCNMLIFEVRNFYPLVQLASFRISPCRLPRLLVQSTRCYAPYRRRRIWLSERLPDLKQDPARCLLHCRQMPRGLTNAMTCVAGETLTMKLRFALKQIKEHYFIMLLPAVVFIESNLYWTTSLSNPTRTYWDRSAARKQVHSNTCW